MIARLLSIHHDAPTWQPPAGSGRVVLANTRLAHGRLVRRNRERCAGVRAELGQILRSRNSLWAYASRSRLRRAHLTGLA